MLRRFRVYFEVITTTAQAAQAHRLHLCSEPPRLPHSGDAVPQTSPYEVLNVCLYLG